MIALRELTTAALTAGEWDAFAIRCDAPLAASRGWLRGWAWHHPRRPRLFEITGGGGKIGQVAVLPEVGRRSIPGGIQLLPEHAAAAPEAIAALLARVGRGRFSIGSRWSRAPVAHAALAALPGVTVVSVRPFAVQSVEFGDWPDWHSYWASVAPAIRRSAASAEQRFGGLELTVVAGPRAWRAAAGLAVSRPAARTTAGEPLARSIAALATLASCRDGAVAATARAGRVVLGGMACVDFGGTTCRLIGPIGAELRGIDWLVRRTLFERAFAAAPAGRFILGTFEPATLDRPGGVALLQARRACRVTDWPSAIVTFDYG